MKNLVGSLLIAITVLITSLPLFANTENHFVLVAGLNNESLPEYFVSLERILKEEGVARISKIMPSSLNTVNENVSLLRDRLLAKFEEGGKKSLIIIAHSKGGLETANTLGRYSKDFPKSVIAKVIFANVPFQGSPYMPIAIKDFENTYGMGGLNMFNPVYINALSVLKSLETEKIRSDLEASFRAVSSSALKEISDRFFYFRSEQTADQISGALRKSADYLREKGFDHNDGLIPVENQKLDAFMGLQQFGNDLGIVRNASHTDIFVKNDSSEKDQIEQIKNLLEKIKSL